MKTPNLTPWFSLYLGESKYNIEIKASRLYVLFYGWGLLGVTFLGGLFLSPLKNYGFITLTFLCLGLVFYQWVRAKTLFFFKYSTKNLSHIHSLRLSAPYTIDSSTPHTYKDIDDAEDKKTINRVCQVSIQLRPPTLTPAFRFLPFKTHTKKIASTAMTANAVLAQDNVFNGNISARSRMCSIGIWLVIEANGKAQFEAFDEKMCLDTCEQEENNKRLSFCYFYRACKQRLKKHKKSARRKTLFLFKDNMSLLDFKRICRLIQYAKYSANSEGAQ